MDPLDPLSFYYPTEEQKSSGESVAVDLRPFWGGLMLAVAYVVVGGVLVAISLA